MATTAMLKNKCVSSFYLVVSCMSKSPFASLLFQFRLFHFMFVRCFLLSILFCCVLIIFTELPAFQMIRQSAEHNLLCKILRIKIDHQFNRNREKSVHFGRCFVIRLWSVASITYIPSCAHSYCGYIEQTLLSCYIWRPTELIRCINNRAHVRVSPRKNNWSKQIQCVCSVGFVSGIRGKKHVNFKREEAKKRNNNNSNKNNTHLKQSGEKWEAFVSDPFRTLLRFCVRR